MNAVMEAPSLLGESLSAIRACWPRTPSAAIILGTGLGDLAQQVDVEAIVEYQDIPHFGKSTALAHQGRLVCGTLYGVPVAVMQGRVHIYEGYRPQQVVLPVCVMHALGAGVLIVTNANGGLNPNFRTGDVVVMEDHINLMFRNVGSASSGSEQSSGTNSNDCQRPHHRLAGRRPPYDPDLIEAALAIARRENFNAYRGVYAAMTGPSYETRAEYRLLRRLGADCVGMSTVPEVIAAAQCGMRVLGLSIVTNVARPDAFEKVSAEAVLHDAAQAGVKVQAIIRGILARLPGDIQ
jgi:purine-nucleoside phosphorylase